MPTERVTGEDHLGNGRFSRISVGATTRILASGSTLLCQLRRKVIMPSAQAPRVLGIDDWAWHRGHRYGTILCGVECGKVVDLLPDRSSDSIAQWLRTHPGTEIVSRDRASLYAQAAAAVVPHAVQVANRWNFFTTSARH